MTSSAPAAPPRDPLSAAAEPAPPRRASDRAVAAALALLVLAASVAANARFLATYALRGDDFALVLHSARFFPASAREWWTAGFAGYFANFPEATAEYTRFLRPTVNASFWLESWLAAGPSSPAFLLTSYAGHALCAALVYLFSRRAAGLPRAGAVLAAALFAGSASALELFHSPAFRGDMLGALFAMTALLLALRAARVPEDADRSAAALLALAILSLLLAVFAKETALAAPPIVAAWYWTERGRRGIGGALLLASPAAIYVAAKVIVQGGGGGAYATIAGLHRSAVQTLSSAFFPGGGAFEALALARSAALPPLDGARIVFALALNAAALALLAWVLVRRRDRRVIALTAATLAALAVPMLLAPYARLMYFGQMFALPLFVLLLATPGGRARRLAAAAMVAALLTNPAWSLARMVGMQGDLAARNEQSRALQRTLGDVVRDPAVRRVYLLDDVPGQYGSLAMMRIAALRAGRTDVWLRVVNSMGVTGDWSRRASPPLRITVRGGELRIAARCAAECDFSFPGVLPENRRRLGVEGIVRYERVGDRALDVAIPGASRGDWALVWIDPSDPRRVRVHRPGRSRTPSVAGGDG